MRMFVVLIVEKKPKCFVVFVLLGTASGVMKGKMMSCGGLVSS